MQALPAGATPVDFAYSVHTAVGHRTMGARVNGRLVPLDSTLAAFGSAQRDATTAAQLSPALFTQLAKDLASVTADITSGEGATASVRSHVAALSADCTAARA